jgi:hypothetical protein
VQAIKLCLEAGASPNAIAEVRAGLSETALHYAASIGASADVIKLLPPIFFTQRIYLAIEPVWNPKLTIKNFELHIPK